MKAKFETGEQAAGLVLVNESRHFNKMPVAQTVEAPETERVDIQSDPATYVDSPKYNLADFPVGTRFKINFRSYEKKLFEVIRTGENYIDMIDLNQGRGRFTSYCLNLTNITFYAERGLIEITRFVF